MSERSAPRFLFDLGGRGGGATFLGGGARGVVGGALGVVSGAPGVASGALGVVSGAPGAVGGGPVGGGGAVKLTDWLVGLDSLRSALGGLRGVTGYLGNGRQILVMIAIATGDNLGNLGS